MQIFNKIKSILSKPKVNGERRFVEVRSDGYGISVVDEMAAWEINKKAIKNLLESWRYSK